MYPCSELKPTFSETRREFDRKVERRRRRRRRRRRIAATWSGKKTEFKRRAKGGGGTRRWRKADKAYRVGLKPITSNPASFHRRVREYTPMRMPLVCAGQVSARNSEIYSRQRQDRVLMDYEIAIWPVRRIRYTDSIAKGVEATVKRRRDTRSPFLFFLSFSSTEPLFRYSDRGRTDVEISLKSKRGIFFCREGRRIATEDSWEDSSRAEGETGTGENEKLQRARRCFPPSNGDVSLDAVVGKTRTCPPMSYRVPSPCSPTLPPSPFSVYPPKRKGWFVADCSAVTHISTRTFWHDCVRLHRPDCQSVVRYFCLTYTRFEMKRFF